MTSPDDLIQGSLGLTKREYFAAKALIGMIVWDAKVNSLMDSGKVENICSSAVLLADALIAELNKPEDQSHG